jgi:hypothetical protein
MTKKELIEKVERLEIHIDFLYSLCDRYFQTNGEPLIVDIMFSPNNPQEKLAAFFTSVDWRLKAIEEQK